MTSQSLILAQNQAKDFLALKEKPIKNLADRFGGDARKVVDLKIATLKELINGVDPQAMQASIEDLGKYAQILARKVYQSMQEKQNQAR